jgi:hypothetical protein
MAPPTGLELTTLPPNIPRPTHEEEARSDVAYNPQAFGLEDYYPQNQKEHSELVGFCNQAFMAADLARKPFEQRWARYYRHYRSYIQRKRGDWHSRVFYPISFWIIETIAPRLVRELPDPEVRARREETVENAETMEMLLDWAVSQSKLYLQMVHAVKTALMYGTGILKVYQRQDIRRSRQRVESPSEPMYESQQMPQVDPATGAYLRTPNGEVVFDSSEIMTGMSEPKTTWEPYYYLKYDGPAASAVDLFHFWVAPEAQDIQESRYTIQRSYKEMAYILRHVKLGDYRLPPDMGPNDITDISDDPQLKRLQSIELGGSGRDSTRQPVELMEYFYDDGRVVTLANRKAILRAHENPFDHGQKPYVRIVDHLVPHEFYGIGEIEPIEGLQDLQNALVNQRVDNIRLVLNAMFAVNVNWIEDLSDLRSRPGMIVRTKGDVPPREAIERIDMGDVTGRAFAESAETQNVVEKVSGVSSYQLGIDNPSNADTATGASIMSEAGATRFALKTRLAEMMAYGNIMEMYGSLLQQFITEPKVVRLLGPRGEDLFRTIDPEALAGEFDYDIDSVAAASTEAQKKADAMSLLEIASQVPSLQAAIPALFEDTLQAFGHKDISKYMPQQLPGQPGQGGADMSQLQAMLQQLPPEQAQQIMEMLQQLPPDQQQAAIQELMQAMAAEGPPGGAPGGTPGMAGGEEPSMPQPPIQAGPQQQGPPQQAPPQQMPMPGGQRY